MSLRRGPQKYFSTHLCLSPSRDKLNDCTQDLRNNFLFTEMILTCCQVILENCVALASLSVSTGCRKISRYLISVFAFDRSSFCSHAKHTRSPDAQVRGAQLVYSFLSFPPRIPPMSQRGVIGQLRSEVDYLIAHALALWPSSRHASSLRAPRSARVPPDSNTVTAHQGRSSFANFWELLRSRRRIPSVVESTTLTECVLPCLLPTETDETLR